MPVIQAMFYVLLGLGSICVFGLMAQLRLAPGKHGQTVSNTPDREPEQSTAIK